MLYTLRRMPGVRRPALSAIFPIFGKRLTFLDVGANADCRPEWLAQFALMGEAYASTALNIQSPSVGLLANGEEDGKGSELVVSAGQIIRKLPIRFVGNVEPRQVLEGKVDVVVTDGFTGNILVKTFEASTRYLARVIRDELRSGVFTSVGGLLARPAFERARARVNTAEIGGAPLLGVNGVVVIAHGSSDSAALTNAIRQAVYAVETNALQAIQTRLALIAPPAPADESEKDG
jgi:glycerol-3-phosphate acyltransferase PlsX